MIETNIKQRGAQTMEDFTRTEYAIWGKDRNNKEEILLCANSQGKPITSSKHATAIINELGLRFNCYDMRIQILDGSKPDFTATIN
jgi:hypothetical protein